MLWAVILAVTLYPLQGWLRRRLHWKEGHIATLIVVVIIAVLLVPVYFMAMSLAESAHDAMEVARSGEFHVPPPSDAVQGLADRGRTPACGCGPRPRPT